MVKDMKSDHDREPKEEKINKQDIFSFLSNVIASGGGSIKRPHGVSEILLRLLQKGGDSSEDKNTEEGVE